MNFEILAIWLVQVLNLKMTIATVIVAMTEESPVEKEHVLAGPIDHNKTNIAQVQGVLTAGRWVQIVSKNITQGVRYGISTAQGIHKYINTKFTWLAVCKIILMMTSPRA